MSKRFPDSLPRCPECGKRAWRYAAGYLTFDCGAQWRVIHRGIEEHWALTVECDHESVAKRAEEAT